MVASPQDIMDLFKLLKEESDTLELQIADITYYTSVGWSEAMTLSHLQRNRIIKRINSILKAQHGIEDDII